jgi:deoxycytidylate deaminase
MIQILRVMAQDVTPVRGAKLASAIMHKNQIVSFGINQIRSHPMQARFGKNAESIFLHAEICSIKNALYNNTPEFLTRTTMFVYRVKRREGDRHSVWCQGNASPCEGCARAIATFGIPRVVASTNQPGIFEEW